MNIIEENFKSSIVKDNKKKSNKKLYTILIVLMLLLVAIIISIVAYLGYLENQELQVTIDGKLNTSIENILVFEGDTVYMPIKVVSQYFDAVESYNGYYELKSEDKSKCYTLFEEQVINYTLGSSVIEKLDLTENKANYEYIELKEPVKAISGELYASSEMIEAAFNISFEYNAQTNRIAIYTLPYLVKYYTTVALDNGYIQLSESLTNQKAIFDGRLIVEASSSKGDVGVIDLQGNTIIEPKYDELTYMTKTGDYLVRTGDSMGVLSDTGSYKVNANYETIEILDAEKSLYLVSNSNGKYGVIDFNGNTIIHSEYDEIGINVDVFGQPEVKNQYVLVDNLVPVKQDEKWALFDTTGKQLTEFIYEGFGYLVTDNKSVEDLLIIPNYEVVVAQRNSKYTLINSTAKELMNPIGDDIYMKIESGEKQYYISANNEIYNAEDYLDSIGVKEINNY